MRALLLLPLLALAMSGCERAERSACPSKDVAIVGRSEGARGVPASLPKTDCVLNAAEQERYLAARAEGLKRYCRAERGYQLAMDKKRIDVSQCDEATAKELQRGFEIGDNLRQFLLQRDELLTQAQDAERLAARLAKDSPERRKFEDQAAGLRFDARQKDNEVEALRGIVAVEKWH